MNENIQNLKRILGNSKIWIKSLTLGDYYKGMIDENHALYPKSQSLKNLISQGDGKVDLTNIYFPEQVGQDIHPLVYRFSVNEVKYLATEGFVVSTPVLTGFIASLLYFTKNTFRNLSNDGNSLNNNVLLQNKPDIVQTLNYSTGDAQTIVDENMPLDLRVLANIEGGHYGLSDETGNFDPKGLKEKLKNLKPVVNVSGNQPINKATIYYDGKTGSGKVNNNPSFLK